MARSIARPNPARPVIGRPLLRRLAESEAGFAYLLLIPAALNLLIFLAYPFVYGIWLSFNRVRPGEPPVFVGFANFTRLLRDDIFHLVVRNALVYTVTSEILKLVLGLIIAHLLRRTFRLRGVVRALLLLPWIVPTVLSALAWSWIYDPTFGVLNWSLKNFGLVAEPPNWRFAAPWPMISLIIVNVWRGTPFFALSFLGALQSIPGELYEAAHLDGATAWQRLTRITLPLLRPVALTVLLLTTIVTFADFQLIHILTGGGPANQTQVFSTYAYQVGLAGGDIGRGAAVSLSMFPVLSALAFSVILLIRRDKS